MLKKNLFIKVFLLLFLTVTACQSGAESNKHTESAGGSSNKTNTAVNSLVQSENKDQESKSSAEPKILWDFRKDELNNPRNFSQAETNAVVKYLFGETNAKIEIRDRLQGSFTKPDAKETLYYLTGCKDEETGKFTTDCPHVSWDSEGWIAIYDGTTPVLKVNEPLGYSIEKVTDINNDGKNEILSFSGYSQSGTTTTQMGLSEFFDGKITGIKGFDGFASNCGFGETLANDKKKTVALVVNYSSVNGGTPTFNEEYFETRCKNDEADKSAWKKITKEIFEEFYQSVS